MNQWCLLTIVVVNTVMAALFVLWLRRDDV